MIEFNNLWISTIRSGKGDCIHLRFVGLSGLVHNIVIDSGPTSTAGEFRKLNEAILAKGESLDILLITHYDDDHIGGILKVGDLGFHEIYFNACDGTEESDNLSSFQAQRLFKTLPSSIVHSSVIKGNVVELDGAKIIVIAPSNDNLSSAMKEMKAVQLAGVSDWNNSFDYLMEKVYPQGDSSISNRASIAFIFEFASARILFCGDAPADSIAAGLISVQHFDLVKLPHHGSIRNISEKMLDLIETHNFIICADGTAHPNKQTIAKLLKHYGSITIYSNYSWWMNGFDSTSDMVGSIKQRCCMRVFLTKGSI